MASLAYYTTWSFSPASCDTLVEQYSFLRAVGGGHRCLFLTGDQRRGWPALDCGWMPEDRRKGYPRPNFVVVTHAGRGNGPGGRTPGGRTDRFGRRKMHSGDNVKQKKAPEPYSRHPEDYYKFGPYGPYAYKLPVVGTPKPAEYLSEDYVALWSSVKDLDELEQVHINNAIAAYDHIVDTFDERIGLQFFLVFVRLPFRHGNDVAWKQWTLVSQVTVESGEQLDKMKLAFRLDASVRNKITHHTGWFRPDLIFVKKPKYQIRFEPESEFIKELKKLLEPVGEAHEGVSFYGKFCKILGVDVDASHEEITSKFEQSTEEVQLAALGHILANNPVQILHPFPYPAPEVWMREDIGMSTSAAADQVSDGEALALDSSSLVDCRNNEPKSAAYDDDGDDDDDNENDELGGVNDENFDGWGSELLSSEEEEVSDIESSLSEEAEDDANTSHMSGDLEGSSDSGPGPWLKAAVRPFTYINFVRELVMLRYILLERKRAS